MQDLQDFYIAAGPAGVGAVFYGRPVMNTAKTLKIHVTSGGPVFFFRGRLSAEEAYRRSHVPGAIDFDAVAGTEPVEIAVSERYGMFTLHSDNETIGLVIAGDGK